MLLVDDDQPEVADRREDGGAGPDRDPGLAGAQPPPLVVALALPQRRVQQRDRVAEARLEAPDGLRRERDLGHEHDRALPARERRLGRAQVDLGLARAGHAVEQERAALLDLRERAALAVRELHRAVGGRVRERGAAALALADRDQPARLQAPQRARVGRRHARQRREQRALVLRQPLALQRRRRPLRPQLGPRPPRRRQHERERPRGRGAVLVRHPERQLHELGRHAVLPHAGRRHELLRRHVGRLRQPDHHAVELLAPERDAHDRAHVDGARTAARSRTARPAAGSSSAAARGRSSGRRR